MTSIPPSDRSLLDHADRIRSLVMDNHQLRCERDAAQEASWRKDEEIERLRKALEEACDLGKMVAWKLHRECPNDLDETEHPNTIRRFNELRALATQKDGGK